jgi:hypothetical protein
MDTVRSEDRTTIAFDKLGDGPAVILVGRSDDHAFVRLQDRARQASRAALHGLPL